MQGSVPEEATLRPKNARMGGWMDDSGDKGGLGEQVQGQDEVQELHLN